MNSKVTVLPYSNSGYLDMSILVEYFEYFGEKEPKILIEYLADP